MPNIVPAAILVLTLAGAATAARPDWVPVGRHIDGNPVEVDRSAITTVGGITRGWWRVALGEPRPDGTAFEKSYDAIDCARRMTTNLATVAIGVNGGILRQTRESESAALTRMTPATPGTTGEMADRAICKLRPRPAPRRR